MKTNLNKNINMFSFKNAFKDNIRHEPMVSLGNSFELLRLIGVVGWRVISACTDSKVSLFRELKILKGFAVYLLIMTKRHGSTYTVKYLKSCHLAIQKCISKDKIKSLSEIEPNLRLPKLTTSRLPRFIPLSDRRAILSGNAFRTRYWLTLYSLYRVIRVPGVLKINTITDPFSGDEQELLRGIEDLKLLSLKNSFRFNKTLLSKEYGLLPIEKASPTAKSSWHGWIMDVPALVREGLDKPLEELLLSFDQMKLFLKFKYIKEAPNLPIGTPKKDQYPSLGQLAIKEEAAGKIRVFALVDVWTQSCLKPLHEMIFSFLKSLPNDGTFDQFAAVNRAAEKVTRHGSSFGYDLSAATDRLPILLQEAVLVPLIGEKAAFSWRYLLTNRKYKLLFPDKSGTDTFIVKYEVGQPMGALSSWAMLALTHHLIVQLAFQNIRGNPLNIWYTEYELLGDDIVLFEKDIAEEYLRLMKGYGVGINLSKSVVSQNKSFEFAKVSWINGQFVSAISWKMFISQNNAMGRVNILYQLLPKMNIKHPIKYLKRVCSRSLLEEGSTSFNMLALLSMYANSGKLSIYDLIMLKPDMTNKLGRLKIGNFVMSLDESYASLLISDLFTNSPIHKRGQKLIDFVIDHDIDWYNISLLTRLTKIKLELGTRENILERFTAEMLEQFAPGYIDPRWKHLFFRYHEEAWEEVDSLWSPLMVEKLQFYFIIRSQCEDLLGDLSFYDSGSIDPKVTTLEDLILVNEKFDRLLEVLKLFSRADEKLQGLALARLSDKSPLKVLQFLKSAGILLEKIVEKETSGWFHDNSDKHFVEDLDFLLKSESLKKVRVSKFR